MIEAPEDHIGYLVLRRVACRLSAPKPDGLPLVRLGPGGDFTRDIHAQESDL